MDVLGITRVEYVVYASIIMKLRMFIVSLWSIP